MSDDSFTDDARFRRLDEAIREKGASADSLIAILHIAQESFGGLSPAVLRFVAKRLKLPPSRVFGVATFYHLFSLTPKGRHECVVCVGTACYLRGSGRMAAAARNELASDNAVQVTEARCLGACGSAPVVVMDGAILGRQSDTEVCDQVREWVRNATA